MIRSKKISSQKLWMRMDIKEPRANAGRHQVTAIARRMKRSPIRRQPKCATSHAVLETSSSVDVLQTHNFGDPERSRWQCRSWRMS